MNNEILDEKINKKKEKSLSKNLFYFALSSFLCWSFLITYLTSFLESLGNLFLGPPMSSYAILTWLILCMSFFMFLTKHGRRHILFQGPIAIYIFYILTSAFGFDWLSMLNPQALPALILTLIPIIGLIFIRPSIIFPAFISFCFFMGLYPYIYNLILISIETDSFYYEYKLFLWIFMYISFNALSPSNMYFYTFDSSEALKFAHELLLILPIHFFSFFSWGLLYFCQIEADKAIYIHAIVVCGLCFITEWKYIKILEKRIHPNRKEFFHKHAR